MGIGSFVSLILGRFIECCKKILNINPVCFVVFGIVLSTYNVYLYYRMGSDQLHQLGSLVNFLNGKGFTLASYTGNGIEYEYLYSWPLLYRIFALPIYLITQGNLDFFMVAYYAFSYLLFYTSVWFFASLFSKDSFFINALLLFLAISFAPLRYYSEVDIITVAIYLFGLGACVRVIISDERTKLWILVAIIAVLTLPNLRYAYVIQSISLPIFILLYNFVIAKNSQLRNKGFILLFFALVGLLGSIANPYFYTKAMSYLTKGYAIVGAGKTINGEVIQSSIIHPLYAVFVTPFFPDYIFLSLVKRFSFYPSIVIPIMLGLSIISLVVLYRIYKFYRRYLNRDILLAGKTVGPAALAAAFAVVLCFLFYVGVYKLRLLPQQDILSGLVFYKKLSVIDRYKAPMALPLLVLLFYIVIYKRDKVLGWLLVGATIFAVGHFSYIKTKFSLVDRKANLYEVNLPQGSYSELMVVYKKIAKLENAVYLPNVSEESLYPRQITPSIVARGSGMAIVTDSSLLTKALNDGYDVLSAMPIEELDIDNKLVYNEYLKTTHFRFVLVYSPKNRNS